MSIKKIYIRINFYIVRLFVNLHYEFVCRGWAGRVFYVETELFRFKILISTLVGTYIDVNRTTAPDQTRRASLIDRPSIVFWYNSEKNREKSVKNVNTNIHQGEVEINSDASLQEAGNGKWRPLPLFSFTQFRFLCANPFEFYRDEQKLDKRHG